MSDRKAWTEEQKKAIYARNKTLLVSAAAGSGKTAVLVERVIQKIIDEENEIDIDKILIVTYTKAAAEEMKQRIINTLEEMIVKYPESKNLKRQMYLMGRAQISTIHSFCSKIIKENFHKIGISPNFKIAEKTEIQLLKEEAMSKVIKSLYEISSKDFLLLSELFSRDRDDSNLIKIIDNLYDFLRPYPFECEWLDSKLRLYASSHFEMLENPFIKTIINHAKSAVDFCISVSERNIEYLKNNEDLRKAYCDTLINDKQLLIILKEKLENSSWNEIKYSVEHFKSSVMRLKSLRGYSNDEIKKKITSNRDIIKKTINDKLGNLFICTEEEFFEDMDRAYPLVKQIFEVEQMFSKELEKIKIEKNLFDFSDLEHLSLKILADYNNGNMIKTAVAREIADNFDEIMIDEYQDVNKVQETIFEAISKDKKNLFMVGDVKQSIYRFRKAMPELFLDKKNTFDEYNESSSFTSEKIILKKNFRSQREVINGVNFVFGLIMSKEMGEIEYNDDEKLHLGLKEQSDNRKNLVDVKILDFSENKEQNKESAEARYIGNLIKEMVNSGYKIYSDGKYREVSYGDFCILLRSAKKHYEPFETEFEKIGVPVWTKKEEDFFQRTEIFGIISLLKVIDNPIQDVPLLAVLYSQIYSFSTDEIAEIRLKERNDNLYYAVLKTSKEESLLGKKCKKLFEQLLLFRQLAVSMSVSDLIDFIYETTGYTYMVTVMKNGDLRLKNLRLLIQWAKEYEQYGAKSLSAFLRILDNAQEKQYDFKSSMSKSKSEKVVSVMSMHSSKGLEFPICIIANTSRKFNFMLESDMSINSNLGVSFDLKDETLLKKYKTLMGKAIGIENRKEALSEEIRILYVAMTRAREKLIIVSSVDSVENTVSNLSCGLYREKLSPYYISQSINCFSIILNCTLRNKGNFRNFIRNDEIENYNEGESVFNVEIITPDIDILYNENKKSDFSEITIDKNILKSINKRFNYTYESEYLSKIPTKFSVSEVIFSEENDNLVLDKRPSFMEEKNMTSAEIGTVIHNFLAYVDFKKVINNIDLQLTELIEKGFLSLTDAHVIDIKKIEKFFESDLFNRMLNSEKLYREYSFTSKINIGEINSSLKQYDDEVILQGEADCIFFEGNEMVLVDYKTGKNLNKEKLEIYLNQLKYYSFALEKCFEKKVKEALIYSFEDGKIYSFTNLAL